MNIDRWQDIVEIVSVFSIVALVSVSPQALAQSESGQGRILFVSEWERNHEIYVMDADGTDKLTSRLVLFSVYARPMLPPHKSKTQRHVVEIVDNVWRTSNDAQD